MSIRTTTSAQCAGGTAQTSPMRDAQSLGSWTPKRPREDAGPPSRRTIDTPPQLASVMAATMLTTFATLAGGYQVLFL